MRKKSTPQATMLKDALEGLGIRVYSEFWDGHKHIDLTIPDAKINIEIDGLQHLTNAEQILTDLSRSHFSDDLGYRTMHIHNDELVSNLEKVAVAIAEAARIQIARNSGKKGWVEI